MSGIQTTRSTSFGVFPIIRGYQHNDEKKKGLCLSTSLSRGVACRETPSDWYVSVTMRLLLLLATLLSGTYTKNSLFIAYGQFVFPLDHVTFPTITQQHDLLLVAFFAPWCGHCGSLLPELQEAAQQLHDEQINVQIATYDVTGEGNKALSKEQQIDGYPTLVLYKKGGERVGTFDGARTHQDIYEYLKKRSGAVFTPISTLQEVYEFNSLGRVPNLT